MLNRTMMRVNRHSSQEVCPFTGTFSAVAGEPSYAPKPELDGPPLVELAERVLAMSDEGFRDAFAGSPVRRARREGLFRNVCVALGNWGAKEATAGGGSCAALTALEDRAYTEVPPAAMAPNPEDRGSVPICEEVPCDS